MANQETGSATGDGRIGLAKLQLAADYEGSAKERQQRERLLAAMIAVAGEEGYERAAVYKVIKAAASGFWTFYKYFDGKDDCFLTAQRAAVEYLVEEVCSAAPPELAVEERVRAGLRALLGALAAEPQLARVAIVEVRAKGAPKYKPYQRTLTQFTGLLEAATAEVDSGIELPPSTARATVNGLMAVISRELIEGRSKGLVDLLPDLVFLTLMPYVGAEAAAREMRRSKSEAALR